MLLPPDPRLASTAVRLSRATTWEQTDELPLRFDAGHPQGMVRLDGRWWIATVDLTTSSGSVVVVDGDGDRVDSVSAGDGVRFHPGGMDFDGVALWLACSEYRPRSSAVIERLVPDGASRPERAFAVDDHVGAVVRLGGDGDLVGWTWGSRRFLRWRVDGTLVSERRNPGQFIDHQDGQWIGGDGDLVLCGGVATVATAGGPMSLGGLGVLSAIDLTIVREVPFPHFSSRSGRAATQNPLFAEVVDDRLVVHLLPDDGAGTILTYATALR